MNDFKADADLDKVLVGQFKQEFWCFKNVYLIQYSLKIKKKIKYFLRFNG